MKENNKNSNRFASIEWILMRCAPQYFNARRPRCVKCAICIWCGDHFTNNKRSTWIYSENVIFLHNNATPPRTPLAFIQVISELYDNSNRITIQLILCVGSAPSFNDICTQSEWVFVSKGHWNNITTMTAPSSAYCIRVNVTNTFFLVDTIYCERDKDYNMQNNVVSAGCSFIVYCKRQCCDNFMTYDEVIIGFMLTWR